MVTADSRAELVALGTSTLSDALDKLRLPGAVPGLLAFNTAFQVSGRAFTVAYEPTDERGGSVGDFLDDVSPGDVVVIDNRGRTDCTVWGDIMTTAASTKGIAGTVIEGVCRDVNRSLDVNYPVFARGRNMQTGKDRVRLAAVQQPVMLGNVSVLPGDAVVGDADGVVVIAQRFFEVVLETARSIEAAESRIRTAVASGTRLDEARQKFGYHALQTPETASL